MWLDKTQSGYAGELKVSLAIGDLVSYVSTQIENFFPDRRQMNSGVLRVSVLDALALYEHCCAGLTRKYFSDGKHALFDHINSDQYAMFLYLLSRTSLAKGAEDIAARVYYLNKILHSLDIYYTVELPEKFMFSHCVGTVLGKAVYGNYFRVAQNCTVGNEDSLYPVFGEEVALYKGSTVAGAARIGNNVQVSAHTFIRGQEVPDNVIVFGSSPELKFKPSTKATQDRYFYPEGRLDEKGS
jgi:serine O-acetyltransferase